MDHGACTPRRPAHPHRTRRPARPRARLRRPGARHSRSRGPGLESLARRHRALGHITTGASRGSGLSPVARDIDDLVLRTGRPAYQNPHWTPAYGDTSLTGDPDDLAPCSHGITKTLAAVHHATDAISQVAADDQQAVLDAATGNRLYVPTRLLPDTYDIPQPYPPAPRAYTAALQAAYDTAAAATARIATALHDLATAIDAPSSLLAAARRASPAARQQHAGKDQQPVPQPHLVAPRAGQTEKALLKLRTRDPALLLRAAVIDQAAGDLITEATAKAHSRDSITSRAARAAQTASQDSPGLPQTSRPTRCRINGNHAQGFGRTQPPTTPGAPRRSRSASHC
jgi:hypothetical protein